MFLFIWFIICHITLCIVIGFFDRDYSIDIDVSFRFPDLSSALYYFCDNNKPLRGADEYESFAFYLNEYYKLHRKFENVISLNSSNIPSLYLFILFVWFAPFLNSVWFNNAISEFVTIITSAFCLVSILIIPMLIRKHNKYCYKDSDYSDSFNLYPLNLEDYSCLKEYIIAERERCSLIIAQRSNAFEIAESIKNNKNRLFLYLFGCFFIYSLPVFFW